MTRVSLVYLIDSLGVGGAERLMLPYLHYFQSTEFRPRVCTFQVRDGNPIGEDLQRMGVPVDLLSVSRLRDPRALPRLVRYLRREQAGLLHTQLEFSSTLGSLAARLTGIPTVCTLHTLDEPPKGTKVYRRLRLMWWSLRHFCDTAIAVSEHTRRHHIRVGRLPADRVITMYNGVDLSRFGPRDEEDRLATRRSLGIPPLAPVLITVAVLRPLKGIQHMIEAMSSIRAVLPQARYVVVGDGEYGATLRELARARDLADHIIFTGVRAAVPDLLSIADVFVLPTLDDALPTVLAEAMASRLPSVASCVGGVPEMVEDGLNGVLVPPGDPSALTSACVRLVQNPAEARRMAQAGYQIASERFNIERQAQRLGELYRVLMSHPRERGPRADATWAQG